jgi:hypothetical protein
MSKYSLNRMTFTFILLGVVILLFIWVCIENSQAYAALEYNSRSIASSTASTVSNDLTDPQEPDYASGTISIPAQVTVVEGAKISGITYEANGARLGGVTITINGSTSVVSAGDGTYQIIATMTDNYTVIANKTGFRDQTQVIEITDLTVLYTLDFKGNNGLVPNTPNISYVLACINRWQFPPGDGTGLSLSKVLSVINAWKFPL